MTKNEKTEAAAAAPGAETSGAMKLSSLRSNSAAQEEGEWNEPRLIPGVKLKTRGFNHVPYRIERDQQLSRLSRKYKKEQSAARDRETAQVFGRLYAKHILLDWEGFDIPYSPDAAMDELSHHEAVTLRAAVEDCAERTGLPEPEFIEDAAKN